MTDLIIVGAGAQARYIINTCSLTEAHRVTTLLDSHGNPDFAGRVVAGLTIPGSLEWLADHPPRADLELMVAVADVDLKRRIVAQLQDAGYAFATIIHPGAIVAPDAVVGVGVLINAGVVVEPGCRIGPHCIIHAGAVLEHDNELGACVNIGPGVTTAGRVRIGAGATVYTGATIIPDISIGADAVVGAGAVVLRDVPAAATVVGVPARPLQGD